VTYGADNVMQMSIPGLYDSDGSGPAISWADEIHLPGSGQIQYIQGAILDRANGSSYFARIPAQDIIVGDAGTNDQRTTATRDGDGAWIMVYSPTGAAFSIDTGTLTGCSVQASWFDPLAGSYEAFDYQQCSDGAGTVRLFTPPSVDGHDDWVLVLET
jgi:hypothetical protein